MAPVEQAAQVAVLVDQLVLLEHAVDPARHRHAGLVHHARRIAALDPVEADAPDGREMLESAVSQAVVGRQRIRIRAEVGRALHVVVAAEDVGTAAGHADVAERELHQTRGAHHRIADGVLRLSVAPDDGARPVLGHDLGDVVAGRLVDAAGLLHIGRGPFRHHLGTDLVHAVDPVVDVLLVFPAVVEDVIHDAEQERNIRSRADAHVFVGLGRRPRETRIDHDHLRAGFLGVQHVQHRHRMRLGRIRADVHRSLRELHVVVGIRHRTVTPRIRHTGDSSGVAYSCLVVAVVAAPHRHPFAQQVRLLVAVLARADDEYRIGAALLSQLEHAGADLVERLIPADALVFVADQLHRILEAEFAVAVLAQRRTLGAVRAHVDRRIEHRLLAHPDAVLDHRVDGAADRAMAAHGALDLDAGRTAARRRRRRGFGLAQQAELGRRHAGADAEAGAAQELAPVHRGYGARHSAGQAFDERTRPAGPALRRFSSQQHLCSYAGIRSARSGNSAARGRFPDSRRHRKPFSPKSAHSHWSPAAQSGHARRSPPPRQRPLRLFPLRRRPGAESPFAGLQCCS